jgi:hypothetical protein
MNSGLLALAAVAALVVAIGRALALDEVRGRLQQRIRAHVESTIASLPSDLQAEWAEEWRAELEATISMPLAAIWFARNLSRGAVELSGDRTSAAGLETLRHERDELRERLKLARADAGHVPMLQLDVWTTMAIVLAVMLGEVTTWPYVQTLDLPVGLALAAGFSLTVSQVVLGALFGRTLHAVMMDEVSTPFMLTVKQHMVFRASACLFGLLAVSLAVALASIRGDVVFVILGLGLVVLSAYAGAAVNDNRFSRVVTRIEKQITATDRRIERFKKT